ncbi:MAG: glycosyltransferase family 4 protein, partial [Kiritimatiellae bacterium]|nr:glycosyltransferase family 4 protein [Kiritimatiellia bacterium]
SANEIAELLPESRGKLFPIPLGISPDFAPASEEAVAELRAKAGLERSYILAVGTIEPRKNLPFLVDAFDMMKNDEVDLVVAGRPGWNCDGILEKFKAARKADRIHHLADVADSDLPALYAGAELYATASLYEGFGLTPLEAMLCGTPVISSCGGSLEEVLSDAAFTLRQFDLGHWALSLDGLLRDRRMRGDLKRRGFSRAQKFRWEETARQTAEIYRKVAGA